MNAEAFATDRAARRLLNRFAAANGAPLEPVEQRLLAIARVFLPELLLAVRVDQHVGEHHHEPGEPCDGKLPFITAGQVQRAAAFALAAAVEVEKPLHDVAAAVRRLR